MLFTNLWLTREEMGLGVYDIKISVLSLLNMHMEISNRYLDL